MTKSVFDWVVDTIITRFKESVAQSGEMVGIIAAQTIGEMGTQMTLNSFHVSGTAAAVQATSGVPRLKEILSVSKNIKTPTMTIYLKDDGARVVNLQENDTTQSLENAKLLAMEVKNSLEITKLSDILISSAIYWDNKGAYDTLIEEDKGLLELYRMFQTVNEASCNTSVDNNWVIRMKFDKFKMASFGLRMIDIHTKLNMNYNDQIECIYSDDNAEISVARIKLRDIAMKNLDSNDNIVAALKAMEDNLVNNVLLKGVKGIKKVSLNKEINTKYNSSTMHFDKITEWVLDTDGTNMQDILIHPDIDNIRTRSNDIREIYEILGIEAARKALSIELTKVIGDKMNYRHMTLLLDTITNKGAMMSIDRHGINRGDVGPLAKSSFEETTDMLVKACTFSEFDKINGVSANIMLGQCPLAGTGDTKIMLDESYMIQLMTEQNKIDFVVDGEFDDIQEEDEGCDDIAFEFTLPSKK
jgi:DNA-directed RNA polymerase II subunit RPB1